MNSGFYAACAGLRAKSEALEVAASNLANASTPAYKAQREFYQSLTAALGQRPLTPLNQAINNFAVLGGSVPDLRPGTLEATGNDLDLGLEGPGFFAVQTPQGIRYTRNGSFHLDASHRIVTAEGHMLLGERGPGQLAPIEIFGAPLSISPDGTVSIGDAVAARLRLVEFAPDTSLVPEGNSYFRADASAEKPASQSRVRQGFLESSNFNPVAGAVNLISIQRQAEMLMRALSLFHSDFNQTAVQDLARVER